MKSVFRSPLTSLGRATSPTEGRITQGGRVVPLDHVGTIGGGFFQGERRLIQKNEW